MIRKMTKEERIAHLSKMTSIMSNEDIKELSDALAKEMIKRTQNMKIMIVDPEKLKIMQ